MLSGAGCMAPVDNGKGLRVVCTCCGIYSRLNHRAMPSGLLYSESEIYCWCAVRWCDRPLVARGVTGCGLCPCCPGACSLISPTFSFMHV